MPALLKHLVRFTLRERRHAARTRGRGGIYLVKDDLATGLVPPVAADTFMFFPRPHDVP